VLIPARGLIVIPGHEVGEAKRAAASPVGAAGSDLSIQGLEERMLIVFIEQSLAHLCQVGSGKPRSKRYALIRLFSGSFERYGIQVGSGVGGEGDR
jgi:hypothetical protein